MTLPIISARRRLPAVAWALIALTLVIGGAGATAASKRTLPCIRGANSTCKGTSDPSDPSAQVKVTSLTPQAGTVVVGDLDLLATVSYDAVVGVTFAIDNTPVGLVASSPYVLHWDSTTVTNGTHTISALAKDASGTAFPASSTVTVRNPTPDTAPPTVSIATPSSGALVANQVTVTASATDSVGVVGVQLKVDGVNLGAERTTAPYTSAWDTRTTTNGTHTLTAVARDGAGNTSVAQRAVSVSNVSSPPTTDTVAPSVSFASPADGATVSGTAKVSVNASDNVAVAGVEFKLDGAPLASEITAAPFALDWNTTGTQSGQHTLTAVARDNAGNRTTASRIVTVPNPAPAPPPASADEPTPITGTGYSRVFYDGFDTFDRTVWTDKIWYDAAPPANAVYAQNGVLNLVSRRSQGYPNITATTFGAKTFRQGYFEARIRWTSGNGAWPGLWLFSNAHALSQTSSSLLCSELDVFEGQGRKPRGHNGALHKNTSGGFGVPDVYNTNNWTDDVGTDLTSAFHTYGALWTATTVIWYLDGRELKRAPVYDSTNQDMFLLLQMWIGGWEGGPDATTPDELRTEVDSVSVWQRP